jgi:hypothetical protein
MIAAQASLPASVLLCLAWLYTLSDELGARPFKLPKEQARQVILRPGAQHVGMGR